MSPNPDNPGPERYVKENQETLIEVIKHSSDKFIRALAIAALIEYGDDPSAEQLLDEIESIRENDGSE
jgi:hypothetical protein